MDDQQLKRDIQSGVKDPLLDITTFEDKSLDEAYGTQAEKPVGSSSTVSQAMIKRFNQHSIMVSVHMRENHFSKLFISLQVLKASNTNTPNNEELINGSAENSTNHISNTVSNNNEEHVNKKQRIQEKISYEDLDTDPGNKASTKPQLNLSKVRRNSFGIMCIIVLFSGGKVFAWSCSWCRYRQLKSR